MDKRLTNKTEILNKIRSGKESRDAAIQVIYTNQKLKNLVFDFVLKSGGQKEDANSIFNISIVKFIKTVIRQKDLNISTTLESYILGIARFSWYDEFAKSNKSYKELSSPYKNDLVPSPEKLIIKQENKEQLHALLAKMQRNCKEVLLHWGNGYSMEEIAVLMKYKSYKMAKKKKYECMKQLLKYLEENPIIKEKLR